MGIPRFFRLAKNKQFHYTPLYYDQRKEELEERIRQIEEEHGVRKDDEYKPGIKKGQMQSYYNKNRAERSHSNIRILLIILFLLFLVYYMFLR